MVKVLFIGDIVGEPGRKILKILLPSIKDKEKINFVIANAENASHGFGLTKTSFDEIIENGVDVLTGGNHTFKKKEILSLIEEDTRILRPANFPRITPGRGSFVYDVNGIKFGVLNLLGQYFMDPIDSPFETAQEEIEKLKKETNIIIIDFHAEATSEKVAMGRLFDGKVSAVLGTHTHIQTADETILPGGTAYISDVGMTGPYDSVLGIKTEIILEKFLTLLPKTFEIADSDLRIGCVIIHIDENTGKSLKMERKQYKME